MRLMIFSLAMMYSLFSLAGQLTPETVLREVYQNNPSLQAVKARAQSEKELILSQYSLSSPRIGFMRESDMSFMQMENGPMKIWSVSQEFMFPTKYFSKGKIQTVKAKRSRHELQFKTLEIRAEALTAYFKYYSASRVQSLLHAQKETLREIARIAEARRSAGSVPQQDEMKAHVEQTKIENEIILQEQELLEAQYALNALLNLPPEAVIKMPAKEFNIQKDAKVSLELLDSISFTTSSVFKGDEAMVEESELEKGLTRMNYLPDFMLTYQQAFGTNSSRGRAIGIEMTVPLWLFTKESSEVASASSKAMAAKRQFESQKRTLEATVKGLQSKVKTLSKLLSIYETALIPQASSTLNSSRSAYSTGRVGFQDLLDAERTLYAIRIEYYENFSKYIEALSVLEREAGVSVSNLPFPGEEI